MTFPSVLMLQMFKTSNLFFKLQLNQLKAEKHCIGSVSWQRPLHHHIPLTKLQTTTCPSVQTTDSSFEHTTSPWQCCFSWHVPLFRWLTVHLSIPHPLHKTAHQNMSLCSDDWQKHLSIPHSPHKTAYYNMSPCTDGWQKYLFVHTTSPSRNCTPHHVPLYRQLTETHVCTYQYSQSCGVQQAMDWLRCAVGRTSCPHWTSQTGQTVCHAPPVDQ